MKRHLLFAAIVLPLFFQTTFGQQPASPTAPAAQATPAARGQRRGGATQPSIQAKPEELAIIKEKTEQIEGLVKDLKASHVQPELVGDVVVYAHAGKMLLEYPDMFGNQAVIEHPSARLIRVSSAANSFRPISRNGIRANGKFLRTPLKSTARFSLMG